MSFIIFQNEKTPKGLVHGFCQKVKMWPCFCFSHNKGKIVFDNILETKHDFKAIKTRSLKNRKFGIFAEGLFYGFGQKCEVWPCFYLFFAK